MRAAARPLSFAYANWSPASGEKLGTVKFPTSCYSLRTLIMAAR
jgi:hypothetical protein